MTDNANDLIPRKCEEVCDIIRKRKENDLIIIDNRLSELRTQVIKQINTILQYLDTSHIESTEDITYEYCEKRGISNIECPCIIVTFKIQYSHANYTLYFTKIKEMVDNLSTYYDGYGYKYNNVIALNYDKYHIIKFELYLH